MTNQKYLQIFYLLGVKSCVLNGYPNKPKETIVG